MFDVTNRMFVVSYIMTLDEYMTSKNISNQDSARILGVTDQAVRMWRKFERTPRPVMQRRIYDWSNGEVTVFVYLGGKAA